jgi:hypothetical protein
MRRGAVNVSDVPVASDIGPMLGEHSVGVVIDFNLPADIKSRTFETKVEASNP